MSVVTQTSSKQRPWRILVERRLVTCVIYIVSLELLIIKEIQLTILGTTTIMSL